MSGKKANPVGVVLAALIALIATSGDFLSGPRYDAVWLVLFALSFIVLFFAVETPAVRTKEEKQPD